MPLAPPVSLVAARRTLAAAALAFLLPFGATRPAAADPARSCFEAEAGARCSLGETEQQTGYCLRERDEGPLRCLSGMSIGLSPRPSERGALRASLGVGPFLSRPAGAAASASSASHLPTLSIAPELDVTPPDAPASLASAWLAFALSNGAGLLGLGLVVRARRTDALRLDEA